MRQYAVFGAILAGLVAFGTMAKADEDAFVEANILGIFYHELGHAIIDIEGLPIFGQEEDAADVFSILMINAYFDADTALDLAYDVALGFRGEAVMRDAEGYETEYWGVHGPDEQRFYNTVCLFYGGDPDSRDDFAAEMDLPEERAEICPDEFTLANDSWGPVLAELEALEDGWPLVFTEGRGFAAEIIAAEVEVLNQHLQLSHELLVSVQECGEPNAFYHLDTVEIVFCAEFEPYLREMFQRLQ
ncbi:MAG: hypothetical protein JXQ79_07990 [Rhodobacteraceae bacterium]|nr:hypothetical protein [Paracoccaceae bacterium]